MSVASSFPRTVAVRVVPSWSLTEIELAPSTTWAAVTMWPFVSMTKPVPVAVDADLAVMSTTPAAVLA